MSSHSATEGTKEGSAAGAVSEHSNSAAGAAAGESGSVHRWLRLPRWMYKGGLGSREPEAQALVHM